MGSHADKSIFSNSALRYFPGQFGFLCERVCDFVIMLTVNVVNSFQSMF